MNKRSFLRNISLKHIPVVLLVSCVSVDPFYEFELRDDYQPLGTADELTMKEIAQVDRFIKDNTNFDAAVLLEGQNLVYTYGDKDLPMNSASIRKSIFSVLFGIAQERGLVDIDMTLEDIEIDDNKQPLTTTEKRASIRQLLQSRSGIYLRAGGETELMRGRRPDRGTFLPGEHFYYNNWDFNILPVILENETGLPLEELIEQWLAGPLGMNTYNPSNVIYDFFDYTEHPQTRIYISAEDLARIGALFLQEGRWNDLQVVPNGWIQESVVPVSFEEQEENLMDEDFFEDYALCWWINREDSTIWAWGFGGQFMIIDKARDLVLVLRNNIGNSVPGFLWNNATSRRADPEDAEAVYNELLKYF